MPTPTSAEHPQRSGRVLGREATVAAFPLGGIGTGNVSIGARGELRDWELMNHPDKGRSLPFTFFAIHAAPASGEAVTRVLESRLAGPHEFDEGYPSSRVAGLPRLRESRMRGQYPVLEVDFEDEVLPVEVSLTAFTPLVPLDVEASGIPAAVLRYRVHNPSNEPIDVTVVGSLSNPIGVRDMSNVRKPGFDGQPSIAWRDDGALRGLQYGTDLDPSDLRYGSLSLVTADHSTTAKPQWLTGFWQDGVQSFWNDLREDGRLEPESMFSLDTNPGGLLAIEHGTLTDEELVARLTKLRVGSLGIVHELAPGESRDFEFVLAWSFPNRPRGWLGNVIRDDHGADQTMLNHYAAKFADSWAAAAHLHENLPQLETSTLAFRDSLYNGSLDAAVKDALGANIAALRSTTCFLLDDGRFVAWEGSFDHAGSCEGTCTHVWNYAQTVAHLFPSLERSARRIEFLLETDDDGRMAFRTNRVFGGPAWNKLPAVDGQLGTIVRLYREWTFSGDDEFLAECWPAASRALDFAFTEWDTDGDLVLDGMQHNTYDIEFYGEDPLGNAFLAAALTAGARMAEHLGHAEQTERYRRTAEASAARTDELLFNGEYYEQRIDDVDEHRYQYGTGVLSDQLLGQLLAHVVGLGHVLPVDHVRSAIEAVYRHNFRSDLSDHHSVQRTYALNDEGGLLLCTWPRGGRPRIPFIYSDEVWTGIEHQVAAHLIYEGFVDEGLTIVRATRARHDGVKRNPWNEAECGNHYARSMASWALLLALSGAHWDATTRTLRFAPATPGQFTSFFSTATAWGRVIIDGSGLELQVEHGELVLDRLELYGTELSPERPLEESSIGAGQRIRFRTN